MYIYLTGNSMTASVAQQDIVFQEATLDEDADVALGEHLASKEEEPDDFDQAARLNCFGTGSSSPLKRERRSQIS